jgi:hypothetical protein
MQINNPVLYGILIEFSNCVKNLGNIMDSTLSWKEQITAVSQKEYWLILYILIGYINFAVILSQKRDLDL